MKTLKKGDRGNEVKEVQKLLHLQADGIFGQLTEDAVKRFQIDNGLVADGIVGINTWRELYKVSPQTKRKITEIILHCSATIEGKDFTVDDIRKWHKANGWSDIGYHYVIYRNGSVNKGRDESISGAHTVNHNSNSIGICYIGGCDKSMKPKDTRTSEQKKALIELVHSLLTKYKLKIDNVHCHNEYANKACPSFKIEDFRKEYNK